MRIPGSIAETVERELTTGIVYSFTIQDNLTQPGSTRIRLFDTLRVQVSVTNLSSIDICELKGVIARTDMTAFEAQPFEVSRLDPQATKVIGTVDAKIVREPDVHRWLDQLGIVSATAVADLSTFRFQEWDKPLVHRAPYDLSCDSGTARIEPGHRPQKRESDLANEEFWGPSIPLARRDFS